MFIIFNQQILGENVRDLKTTCLCIAQMAILLESSSQESAALGEAV